MRRALLWTVMLATITGNAPPSGAANADHVPGYALVRLVPEIAGDVVGTDDRPRGIPEDRLGTLFRALRVRHARRLFAPAAPSYAAARAQLARAAARSAAARGQGEVPLPRTDLANVFVLELAADADVGRTVAALAADPAVMVAQPDHSGHALLVPDDPRFTCATPPCAPGDWQWALQRVRASEAWEWTRGTGVTVAIIDSGLNRGHLDLGASMWGNPGEVADGIDNDANGYVDDLWGWDFVACNAHALSGPPNTCVDPNPPGGDADPSDDEGHGTAVGAIVGAVTDNGLDMAGLADGARLMAVRAVNKEYRTSDAELMPALVYAATNGARIINMSLVIPPSPLLADAIEYAHELGVLLVAAAGNSGDGRVYYPAGYPEVVAVGSTDIDDYKSVFSTFNDQVELTAPGEQVLSLRGIEAGVSGVHGGLSGTSVAAPHVAGIAALLWSWNSQLSEAEVRAALCAGAVDLGVPGRDPFFGCGRADAVRTLQTQCIANACGDGLHEPACGEECEDGNARDGDCCSAACRLEGFGVACSVPSRQARACQRTLASRAQKLGALVQRETQRCLDRLIGDVAAGRSSTRAAAVCAKRLGDAGLGRARTRARATIMRKCAGADPAALGPPCAPTATSMDAVVACVLDRHVAAAGRLAATAYADACTILRALGLDGRVPGACAD